MVIEAAEAVEATIMNAQTLKELGIEQKEVPFNINNEKKSLRFWFQFRQKCVLGRDFAPLGFYYGPRFARSSKANPREQSPALRNTFP